MTDERDRQPTSGKSDREAQRGVVNAGPPGSRGKPRKRSGGLTSLRGDREFRQVRKGRVVRTPYFTLRAVHYRPRHGEPYRPMTVVGIVAAKKSIRLAVDRNRARRRVREAMRGLELPACRAMVQVNPSVLDVDFQTLRDALARAFDTAAP